MKDEISLQITESGTIRSIYKDGESQELRDLLDAKMTVARASNVEWEEFATESGWTVRAAWDPEIAIRRTIWDGLSAMTVCRRGRLFVFGTREEALKAEVSFFWYLLPEETK